MPFQINHSAIVCSAIVRYVHQPTVRPDGILHVCCCGVPCYPTSRNMFFRQINCPPLLPYGSTCELWQM